MPGLVRMRALAPFHLGEAGLGLEESSRVLHSDTLFSGLFHAWQALYGEPMPEMTLSSAFPFVGETLYFPRPFLPVPGMDGEQAAAIGKLLKHTSLVSLPVLARWLAGEAPDFRQIEADNELLRESLRVVVRPRVSLDRASNASSLYFVGETALPRSGEAGLFFLVDAPEESWPRLQAAIRLLGEEGVGGRRSQGYGIFQPDFQAEFSLPEPGQPDAFLALSLVYPAGPAEVAGNLVAYQLLTRTGWLESPGQGLEHLHRRVIMFGEGSVFRTRPRGRLVDVTPRSFNSHPVYRNGRAFTVGVRIP